MKKYKNISFLNKINDNYKNILSDKANDFFLYLLEKFNDSRNQILKNRKIFDQKIADGQEINFLNETKEIRISDWQVPELPSNLKNRQVEITGPVDRKMIINGLNSQAMVYMADFEDSQSPTWDAIIQGQINLKDAVRGCIEFTNPQGKNYQLNDKIAQLIVRPRGLHLNEKNVLFNGKEVSASLFDFSYYFFHNIEEWQKQNKGIYFYIPKLEHYQEARFWKEVFAVAEAYFKLPIGTIKATVLIETITAVFEMHEIIYELKNYCVGLNCGRWDYIFSYIKKQSHLSNKILPNRMEVHMGTHFLRNYSKLLIDTCHKRGIMAMGGMAAQIPIKNNPEKNNIALEKVKQDKEREASTGHDGTWVAHPGLVEIAKNIFSQHISGDNQISKRLPEAEKISNHDLLQAPEGTIDLTGFENNIKVSLHYLAAWLSGNGCVPINHLMEDLATAEIARAQLWQWVHHPNIKLKEGVEINQSLFLKKIEAIQNEFKNNLTPQIVDKAFYFKASELIKEIVLKKEFTDFLSVEAYKYL